VPDKINIAFLKKFSCFIKKQIRGGNKFVIIVGGGRVCRKYQKAASKAGKVSNEDRDWIGIYSSRLNNQLLKAILKAQKIKVLFNEKPYLKSFGSYQVIVGWQGRPGCSTDLNAVKAAIDLKINRVVMLSKPAYVYTANPDKVKTAKPIKRLTWGQYFKIMPSKKWQPGLNAPVDPVAAKTARENNIEVIVASGKNLKNLEKIIHNKPFRGTTITNQ